MAYHQVHVLTFKYVRTYVVYVALFPSTSFFLVLSPILLSLFLILSLPLQIETSEKLPIDILFPFVVQSETVLLNRGHDTIGYMAKNC